MRVRANQIAVGDVLGMAVGPSRVVALYEYRGGVECVVAAENSESEAPGTRVLWFWPRQTVNLLRGSGAPQETLAPRPVRGAAARSGRGTGER